MLEAIFQEGILSLTLAGLTQWDYGQKLTIKGLTVSSALEVHFSNNAEKEAIVMSATKSGSDIITEIPNVLLEKDKDITAWVYTDDGQSGETIRTIVLKVTPRIKPADYISENNAGKVIDYVAKAEEYASSAQESAEIAQDNAEKVQANTDLVQDILANVPDFDSYEKLAEHNKILYDGLYVKGETYSGIASNKGIKLHKVVGKTLQDGEPSPDNEVHIQNVEIKNLYSITSNLIINKNGKTQTSNGVTFTKNDDGSITINGTATGADAVYSFFTQTTIGIREIFLNKQLCVSGVPKGSNIRLQIYNSDGNGTLIYDQGDTGTGFFTNKNSNYNFSIVIFKGRTINNVTLYPKLEYGSTPTEYEPYKNAIIETSLTLAEGDVFETGVAIRKMKEANVTRDFAFSLQGTYENTLRFDSQYLTDKKSTSGKGYCNLLPKGSDSDNGDYEHFRFSSANKGFVIYINKSRLETPDVSGLAKYLDTAGMKLLYELDVPTTETLKVPTIPSYNPLTNVWTDNTLPTDIEWELLANSDNSLMNEEILKRIEALEAKALER